MTDLENDIGSSVLSLLKFFVRGRFTSRVGYVQSSLFQYSKISLYLIPYPLMFNHCLRMSRKQFLRGIDSVEEKDIDLNSKSLNWNKKAVF